MLLLLDWDDTLFPTQQFLQTSSITTSVLLHLDTVLLEHLQRWSFKADQIIVVSNAEYSWWDKCLLLYPQSCTWLLNHARVHCLGNQRESWILSKTQWWLQNADLWVADRVVVVGDSANDQELAYSISLMKPCIFIRGVAEPSGSQLIMQWSFVDKHLDPSGNVSHGMFQLTDWCFDVGPAKSIQSWFCQDQEQQHAVESPAGVPSCVPSCVP